MMFCGKLPDGLLQVCSRHDRCCIQQLLCGLSQWASGVGDAGKGRAVLPVATAMRAVSAVHQVLRLIECTTL
jgi:hypothetical protein